jgi:hypothetical protein
MMKRQIYGWLAAYAIFTRATKFTAVIPSQNGEFVSLIRAAKAGNGTFPGVRMVQRLLVARFVGVPQS